MACEAHKNLKRQPIAIMSARTIILRQAQDERICYVSVCFLLTPCHTYAGLTWLRANGWWGQLSAFLSGIGITSPLLVTSRLSATVFALGGD